jgi:hypothetical protein
MNQALGRGEHQPWATKWPVSSLGAMLIAAVVGIGIFTYCNIEMWTPLEQWYWVQYFNTKSFPTAHGDYKLLHQRTHVFRGCDHSPLPEAHLLEQQPSRKKQGGF